MHSYIAGAYYQQDQFEESLSYHMKTLEIEQSSSSNDHSSIATTYFNISKDYAGLSFWSDANTLASYNHHVGHVCHQQHEYEKALRYYNEALNLSLTHLPADDASLVVTYYLIAGVYDKLKRYEEALSFYQKTLNIELKTLPDNAKTIAATYTNISTVYFHLKQFDNAFIAANEGLDQLLKTLPKNHPEVVQQRAYLDAIKMSQILEDKHK